MITWSVVWSHPGAYFVLLLTGSLVQPSWLNGYWSSHQLRPRIEEKNQASPWGDMRWPKACTTPVSAQWLLIGLHNPSGHSGSWLVVPNWLVGTDYFRESCLPVNLFWDYWFHSGWCKKARGDQSQSFLEKYWWRERDMITNCHFQEQLVIGNVSQQTKEKLEKVLFFDCWTTFYIYFISA